jgi:HK97 family phage portal protein
MSLIRRALEGRMPTTLSGIDIAETSSGLQLLFDGGPTSSGVAVSEATAENLSAVYGCVRLLSEVVAGTPLRLLSRATKEPATGHPLYTVLTRLPNPEMTAFDFRKAMMSWMLVWGNAYAQVVRDPSGRVEGLYPLRSDRMVVDRSVVDAHRLRYTYTVDGAIARQWIYDGDRPPVHHWRWDALDGITGRSRIRLARESLGITKAAEELGARFFGGGSRPSGVLQSDQKLSVDVAKRMRDEWERMHRGPESSSRVAVLEQGLKWTPMSVPPDDAQFLETRRFQLEEIAGRWFGIPPHMVGHTSTSTSWGTGIESQKNGFATFTVEPYYVAIQQWVEKDLMGRREFDGYEARFDTNKILRGDMSTRVQAYSTGLNARIWSVNEVRQLEDLPALPGGDQAMPFLSTMSQPARADAKEPE